MLNPRTWKMKFQYLMFTKIQWEHQTQRQHPSPHTKVCVPNSFFPFQSTGFSNSGKDRVKREQSGEGFDTEIT